MKSILSFLIISLLITACQQTRLLNFRNLTLVESDAELINEVPEDIAKTTTEINPYVASDRLLTTPENATFSGSLIDPFEELEVEIAEEELVNSLQKSIIFKEINDIPTEIVFSDLGISPVIAQDSTKKENRHVSKEDAGKIFGIFGGLSLIVFLFFAALAFIFIFAIVIFIWIVFIN
ncbi:MAG: hypothetical protein GQ574_16655 [Crocinitomix sp.]|nr:hypothetical protein [Crocinitomix sp.]